MTVKSPTAPWRVALARALALSALVASLVAAHALVVGGFVLEFAGVRLSARSVASPLIVALVLAALAWGAAGTSGAANVTRWLNSSSGTRALAATLGAVVAVTGVAAGLDVAGSADASGYVAEARLFVSGTLHRDEPLAVATSPPLGAGVVAPLGFRPADEQRPTRQVPTYAPGLPIVMAIAERVAGPRGPFLVVPLAGALAVWLVFVLGERVGSSRAGLASAWVLTSTPVFLFQLLQPMSDVPVTAAWLAAFVFGVRDRPLSSGMASALAIAIRPNLAPLVVPIAFLATAAPDSRAFVTRWIAGLAPGIALVAALHTVWYGAPWRSGYGGLSELFDVSNVLPNTQLYSTWLVGSAPGLTAAALAAVVASIRGSTPSRLSVAFLCLNIAIYLPYATFESWHYARFLLPGLAVALPTGTALVARLAVRPWLTAFMVVATLLAGSWQLRIADGLDVFRLRTIERRYGLAAAWLASQTPDDAVIATAQQSGSVVLNARRSVLRWDLLEPGTLGQAVQLVEATGRPVWLLVETWEQPALRARHGDGVAALDWPPAVSITAAVPVTAHRVADRARFLAGASIPTEHVTDRRR